MTTKTAPNHLSATDRLARGKAARQKSPRSSLAEFSRDEQAVDPIAILEQQAATRVPELVPIRYGRMLASPFAFFRGAAAVMAADLAGRPTSGIQVQACGDAHLMNFGVYMSPERRLVFDINDFDETLPGPWEWDVKRLTASLVIAGLDRGFTEVEREMIVRSAARRYREAMQEFASMRNLEVWYSSLDVEILLEQIASQIRKKVVRTAERNAAKATSRDNIQAFDKMTEMVGGEPRFRSQPPLIQTLEDLDGGADREGTLDALGRLLKAYRRTLVEDRRHLFDGYRLVDVARKVVGVGSVGSRAWVLLLLGRDERDPLILQAKEAQASVLEPYAARSQFTNSGQRVVAGQRLMQATSDIFLGWQRFPGFDGITRDYYVRQLRDGKASANLETMSVATMDQYARMCGWTLARAHARSGDRIALASYLGRSETFDSALVWFAEAYGNQNIRDHAALTDALKAGRVKAETGV